MCNGNFKFVLDSCPEYYVIDFYFLKHFDTVWRYSIYTAYMYVYRHVITL